MAAPGGPHGRDGKKRNGRAVFFRQMDDGRLFRHRVARYVNEVINVNTTINTGDARWNNILFA